MLKKSTSCLLQENYFLSLSVGKLMESKKMAIGFKSQFFSRQLGKPVACHKTTTTL